MSSSFFLLILVKQRNGVITKKVLIHLTTGELHE